MINVPVMNHVEHWFSGQNRVETGRKGDKIPPSSFVLGSASKMANAVQNQIDRQGRNWTLHSLLYRMQPNRKPVSNFASLPPWVEKNMNAVTGSTSGH